MDIGKIMKIKIFGPGCARCLETENIISAVVKETGSRAIVEKVTDLKEIMISGVISTPAVMIDGIWVCNGRIPTKEEVTAWIAVPTFHISHHETTSCCHCK